MNQDRITELENRANHYESLQIECFHNKDYKGANYFSDQIIEMRRLILMERRKT